MSMVGTGPSLPGINPAILTAFTNQLWWGDSPRPNYFTAAKISSATVDAGNTPTTSLRQGLLLGIESTNNEWKEWNPLGVDGSEVIRGVLCWGVSTLNAGGVAEDKFIGWVSTWGRFQSGRLLIPGNASVGISADNYEFLVRRQMKGRFQLDDEHLYPAHTIGDVRRIVTADLTVTPAMNGYEFITTGASGAVVFTLPTPYPGLIYDFIGGADQNLTVTAATADTITTVNNLQADGVAFSTTNMKIGARVRLEGLTSGLGTAANGRWLATNLSVGHTMTVVDA
jgi:hypothetical protein